MVKRFCVLSLLFSACLSASALAQDSQPKSQELQAKNQSTFALKKQGQSTPNTKSFAQTYDWFLMTTGSLDGASYAGYAFNRAQFTLGGSFLAPLSGNWAVQGDAEVDEVQYSQNSAIPNGISERVGGHLFWRDPQSGLIGINTEIAHLYFTDAFQSMRYSIGPEIGYYKDRNSFSARATYRYWANNFDYGNSSLNYWSQGIDANGSWTYFVTNNFSTGLMLGAGKIFNRNQYLNFDYTAYRAGATAEYKFEASQFSLFSQAMYERGTLRITNFDLGLSSFRVLLGLKYNFGDKSLFDRDRSGASLKNAPEFHLLDDIYAATLPAG